VTRGAVRDVMLSRLHIHDVGAGGVSVEKPADYEDGSAVRNLSLVDSRIHVSESVTSETFREATRYLPQRLSRGVITRRG
jgi:hypothetical protein